MVKIKVSEIIVSEVNKEIYSLSSIEELMKSIKLVGLLQNPVINSKTKNLLSGHRRLEAVTRLGWDEIEVDTIEVDEDDEILYLIHFNQTRVKSVLSILREYDFLRDYYNNNKERLGLKGVILRGMIAEDLKISDGQLARLLKIRKESPDSIELIDKGILSINQAYILTQRNEKEKKSRTIINENYIDHDILSVAVSNQKYSNDIQHPAQFPRQLVWLILNSTVYLPFINKNYSPIVLDPFAGALGVYNGTKWFNDNFKSNIKFVGYDIKKWF